MNEVEKLAKRSGRSNVSGDSAKYVWVTEFTDVALKEFFTAFSKLEGDDTMGFIPVVISSYGGSVHNLAAMRDMIKAASKPVATIAIGKAMSAGIGLLACGTKGMRFAASDASMMIHEASSMAWGKSSDVTNEAKDLERATRQYLGNLAKDMGKKFKDLRKELDKHRNVDWYLSAKQAQKWGVVDHVGFPKIIKKSEFYNLEGMVTSAAKKRVRK